MLNVPTRYEYKYIYWHILGSSIVMALASVVIAFLACVTNWFSFSLCEFTCIPNDVLHITSMVNPQAILKTAIYILVDIKLYSSKIKYQNRREVKLIPLIYKYTTNQLTLLAWYMHFYKHSKWVYVIDILDYIDRLLMSNTLDIIYDERSAYPSRATGFTHVFMWVRVAHCF